MRKRVYALFAILIIFALTVSVWAGPVTTTITVTKPAKIAGTELKAGEYQISVLNNKVTVMRGSKVVAEVQGEWVERKEKARYTTVIMDNNEIREIRFGGKTQVLVFR